MPPGNADLAQANGFKAFPGIRQGDSLIQSRYQADYQLFPTKQSGYPCRMPSSDSSPPSLSPVTRRVGCVPVLRPGSERCTMKQVSRLIGPMWNKGIFLQIRRYCQGRKVRRLKAGWLNATQTGDIARQSRASYIE